MADINHLCLGCMEDKGSEHTCPHCGWQVGTPEEAPQHLPPGMILHEKYLIGRVLGHGGFGITYLAWDLNLDMKLAIKEYMPRDFATRTPGKTMVSVFTGDLSTHFEQGLTKFLDEAKTLAQFSNHPGIVGVRDFFKENGTAYLVMYYLEGIDFKQYLETQGGKIPYETALLIMMPVMDALREVHRTGTLHRDISPDNIYITAEGQVKVLDFGAARHAISEFSKSISVILKPGFAPEEQYRSKGKQGPWTDVYATAATFYRAVVGHVPPESLDRLEDDTIVLPSSLGVNIPKNAESALMKALSVRAADRYQSMEDFQDELFSESKISEQPITPDRSKTVAKLSTVTPENKPEKHPNKPQGKKSTSKWFWIGGGIALAILLTVGVIATFLILDSIAAEEYEKKMDQQRAEEAAKSKAKTQNTTKEVTVPNLVNQSENEAKMLLQKEGLQLGEIKYTESLLIGKGVVISQSIQANEKAKENDTINLEVSKGVDLPIDIGTIKSKGLNLVYEYWDKGYNQSVKEDYETSLRYYLQARGMALVLYEENKDIESQHTIGVLDYNISINKSNLGYYELALPDIESSVNYLEGIPKDYDEHIEDLGNSYGQLAYIQFLNKMPAKAIESAEKALDLLDEDDIFIYATMAHALLFAGEYEEAIDLYAELKDEVVGDGESFGDYILEDFRYFREIGLTHPDMDEVERIYAEMGSLTQDDLEDELMTTIYANAIAFENEDLEGYKLTLDPAVGSTVDKDMTDVFQAYDNIVVEFESMDVIEMLESTAKVRVVQVLSYSQGANNYESKSTLVHHFIRSDGLYKWLITRTDVEGG